MEVIFGKRALLGVVVFSVMAVSVAAGLASAQQSGAGAQAGDAVALPKYEVASIKPHLDEGMMMQAGMHMTPDGVSISGVPLQMLVRQAFGLSDDRILNEPDWVKSVRFDIEAKVSPEDAPKLASLSMQQRGEMMLPLLEERFGLKFHNETRVLPVLTLEIDKGGPKLKEAKPESESGGEADRETARPSGPNNAREPRMYMSVSGQGMKVGGSKVTMPMLAQLISQQTGNTVVDKTGLTGKYDVSLTFEPEMNSPAIMRMPAGGPPPESAPTSTDSNAPSLKDALQEQLGLKLAQGKESVEVVVIDQFERPSAN